ncbi:uncharacterized protein EI90DRAFT_3130516 [Cantharellus anzutake]|uniref:uncharacterized protein n=1 Tax=Cantharellus anzutake TaxID=1750568 RepID=UPI00190596B5|nr:uncharacterized protein EI90DRAFT_3130516 [Cantharellus anzutake]KAF8322989.1 hypothetical protein EI90DRAFT_3130516 [Cantharellus anzutake]
MNNEDKEDELNYLKSLWLAAECVFESYIQASCRLYTLDDKEVELFKKKPSDSYVLDYTMACKVNGQLPKTVQLDLKNIEGIIPREVFMQEMAHMVKDSLLAPLLEVRTLMWDIRALTVWGTTVTAFRGSIFLGRIVQE